MRDIITAFSLLILPVIASGHHSRAEFTDEMREIEGVLTDVISGATRTVRSFLPLRPRTVAWRRGG